MKKEFSAGGIVFKRSTDQKIKGANILWLICQHSQHKGQKIFKTVYFYLMKHLGGDFKDRDHEMMDVRWSTEEEVKKTLTYDNDKKAFEEALKIFQKLSP